jgi:hypothetical protein
LVQFLVKAIGVHSALHQGSAAAAGSGRSPVI